MRRFKEHTFAVCAYKESPYLEDCIRSLKSQTVQSNIIIVTSTPNAHIENTAEKYGVPYLVNEGEGGIAQDWNFGYEQSKTRYVTIAHQDDWYEPVYLETALQTIKKTKKPLIFFCDYGELRNGERIFGTQLLKVKRHMLRPLRSRRLQTSRWLRRRILALGNPICCPSVTYCTENLPSPLFEAGYESNVDWQAWERISRLKGSFAYVPKPLMLHRIHSASTTSELIRNDRRWVEDYEMFRRFWPDPAARLIVKFYRRSETSNTVKEDTKE